MLTDVFVTFIYQPFLNLLVGLYWLLQQLPVKHADMGVAVILFTIAVRLLLLPMSLSSSRSEKERKEIEAAVKEIKKRHVHDPVGERQEIKRHLKTNRRVMISEAINLVIQIIIALMLWRIFARGLLGADLHLIYGFMPPIDLPFNLVFWGKYDLTHPHTMLNLVQSAAIFLFETARILTSPYPISRNDAVRMQLVIPFVSFIIFSQLPAGKKLFVITTLIFSLVLTLVRYSIHVFNRLFPKVEDASETQTSQVANS